MNILFCSAGRRCELIKDFKRTLEGKGKIIAADMNLTAPALYVADNYYIVPEIKNPKYIETIIKICINENIQAVTTCIDPEITLLAKNRSKFKEIGVEVLAPYEKTAEICFDKYEMYKFLVSNGVNTVKTYENIEEFNKILKENLIKYPIFVKPRNGSASIGARKIENEEQLNKAFVNDPSLIIQEFMGGSIDIDVDAYIDTISHKVVSIFSKKKISTKIGGADKTISFKDDKLVQFVCNAISHFKFNGPIDMDLWYKDGEYYLSEINPRFGGAYLHAYGCNVDFVKLIENNINGIENKPIFQNYDDEIAMMMYDSVVIHKMD